MRQKLRDLLLPNNSKLDCVGLLVVANYSGTCQISIKRVLGVGLLITDISQSARISILQPNMRLPVAHSLFRFTALHSLPFKILKTNFNFINAD